MAITQNVRKTHGRRVNYLILLSLSLDTNKYGSCKFATAVSFCNSCCYGCCKLQMVNP